MRQKKGPRDKAVLFLAMSSAEQAQKMGHSLQGLVICPGFVPSLVTRSQESDHVTRLSKIPLNYVCSDGYVYLTVYTVN